MVYNEEMVLFWHQWSGRVPMEWQGTVSAVRGVELTCSASWAPDGAGGSILGTLLASFFGGVVEF